MRRRLPRELASLGKAQFAYRRAIGSGAIADPGQLTIIRGVRAIVELLALA